MISGTEDSVPSSVSNCQGDVENMPRWLNNLLRVRVYASKGIVVVWVGGSEMGRLSLSLARHVPEAVQVRQLLRPELNWSTPGA